eukprot:CAMPEP_0119308826 /NCGR_PEP_ID=MMETSP1333-20130426/12791_1 /TAXON_ID=418940 /ORGANISM="Scyphosphaera apsteinii, Strain RCC1455" /LENGTH=309 /DNA_ID=CAMNT_0007312685 /DNA_START=26 /DNA_END=955 /DNA_ORIENTATION=-
MAYMWAAGFSWMPQRVVRFQATPSYTHRSDVPKAVFSGIVEEMGQVRRMELCSGLSLWDGSMGEGWELEVAASEVLDGAYLGCSIAVNGVCLTVTEFDSESFVVGLAPETLRRSNLGDLKNGAAVNLERALPADGRNSGHFVQGHVDDVGVIEEIKPDGEALWIRVKPPARLMPYIVPKGFIAVDGTSLTVCNADPSEGSFDFMLVSYTQKKIILPKKKVGETVNLEVDVTAKYVQRSMGSIIARVEAMEQMLALSMRSMDRLDEMERILAHSVRSIDRVDEVERIVAHSVRSVDGLEERIQNVEQSLS